MVLLVKRDRLGLTPNVHAGLQPVGVHLWFHLLASLPAAAAMERLP